MKATIKNEFNDLINKIGTSIKMGVFLGAGSSMSAGMAGINDLTKEVIQGESFNVEINNIREIENKKQSIEESNVEDILNSIRKIRDITGDSKEFSVFDINGEEAFAIDKYICKTIYDKISSHEQIIESNKELFDIFEKFVSWANFIGKKQNLEIYTTNYDLLLEKAFESRGIPYFDGFIGSNKAFFHQESVENIEGKSKLPSNWIRLWKLHGSLNWFWNKARNGDIVNRTNADMKSDNEIVIYPSKEKYSMSRKQPFTTYFDRLRAFLNNDETLFVVHGYSFNDQHINEVLYSSLTNNNRLHMIVFFYDDEELTAKKEEFLINKNITVLSPKYYIKSSTLYKWDFNQENKVPELNKYIDYKKEQILLSDFKLFSDFLIRMSNINYEDEKNEW